MDVKEAVGNLESVKKDRFKAKLIDGFDWLDTCELAIEALERTRWIPVSERLPDDFDWNLVCGKYYSNRVAYYDLKIKTFKIDGEELFHVTHWMPLPSVPQEVD